MISAAKVTHHTNGTAKVSLYEEIDNETVKVKTHFLDVYVMKDVQLPKHRFHLSPKNYELFKDICSTPEGRACINKLKNEYTDKILNDYIKNEISGIPAYSPSKDKSSPQTYKQWLQDCIKTRLEGRNHINGPTLGVGKREIWEAFIREKLIVPDNQEPNN